MPAPEQQEHTVRSYDEQLRRLRDTIARMGGLAERQVETLAEARARQAALAARRKAQATLDEAAAQRAPKPE